MVLCFSLFLLCISSNQEQWEKDVSENSNPSKKMVKETQPKINENKSNEVKPIESLFGDFWPNHCLEFSFKHLTSAIPTYFDDNLDFRNSFHNYTLSQAKEDENLWSNSSPYDPVHRSKSVFLQ